MNVPNDDKDAALEAVRCALEAPAPPRTSRLTNNAFFPVAGTGDSSSEREGVLSNLLAWVDAIADLDADARPAVADARKDTDANKENDNK